MKKDSEGQRTASARFIISSADSFFAAAKQTNAAEISSTDKDDSLEKHRNPEFGIIAQLPQN
jgi:hypothetical protein